MKTFLKYLTVILSVLGISSCQSGIAAQKGLSVGGSSSPKVFDIEEPLTVIGGDLDYDLIKNIRGNTKLYGLKFNPKNNGIIAYGDDSEITVYNLGLQVVGTIESKNDEVKAVDVSLDGNYLVCGGDDGYVEIWNLNDYKLLHRMRNGDDILAVAISSDNKRVASGGGEKVIDVWDLSSGEQIARLEGHRGDITDIGFIDFNRKIVSTAKDKNAKIWDVTKKRLIYSYLTPTNEYGAIKKAKPFDDYTITALTEVNYAEGNSRRRNGPPVWKYTIKFQDHQGNILNEFNQHKGVITDIAVATNRSYMASSSEDNTVRLWDLEKKKLIATIVLKDKGNGVAINKSGHILVALEGKNTIKLFQIKSSYSPTDHSSSTALSASASKANDVISSWYNKQYAIVVGIDHYKKLSLPRLNNAIKDARSVASLLRKKGFSVIELYNENATKERILDALKKIKQLSTPRDATLFYFAGHGDGVSGHNNVREGYILPYDFGSDLNSPNPDVMYYDKSAVSISALVMYSRDTKAKHIGIILDSCFSGLAMDSKYAKKSLVSSKKLDHVEYDTKTRSVRIKPTKVKPNESDEINNIFKKLLSKKSINILTAGDDQPVSDGSGHSPFTSAFLEMLNTNNEAGYVRFSTLADYIKKYVEEKTRNRQKPQYKNESFENGDFIFRL